MVLGLLFISSCEQGSQELIDQIQGEWVLDGTSGTITGGGISTAWNEVSIEGETFDLINVDTVTGETAIIASGNIIISSDDIYELTLTSTTIDDLALELDPEKMISVTANQMDWFSPCCDRINYHFILT